MRTGGSRTWRLLRLLGGTGAAVAVVLVTGATSGPAAAGTLPAATTTPSAVAAGGAPAPAITVKVTQVAPAALTPGSTLTLAGAVHNGTSAPLRSVTVKLWNSQTLDTRAAVTAWQAGGSDVPAAGPLRQQRLDRPVPAGADWAFTVTVDADALAGDQHGALAVRGLVVRASATSAAAGPGPAEATARTFTV